MEQFIKKVIDNLKLKKVEYGDVRIVEREAETIMLKNGVLETVTHATSTGFGVRVLKDSAWGFSSSNLLKNNTSDKVTKDALNIARASARIKSKNIVLAHLSPQNGTYRTKIELDPMTVSLDEKIALLFACDKIMRKEPKVKVSMASLRFYRIKTYFASTADSLINQEMVFAGGGTYVINPVLQDNLPLVITTLLLGIALDIFLLWKGRWTTATRVAKIAVNLFEVAVLAFLVAEHSRWLASYDTQGLFSIFETIPEATPMPMDVAQALVMWAFRLGFFVALVVLVVETVQLIISLVRQVFFTEPSRFTTTGGKATSNS